MILKSKSNKMRKLREEALEAEVLFTNTMTIETFEEQLKIHAETKNENLNYFGIVLFGDWDKGSKMTRKFSLWKS